MDTARYTKLFNFGYFLSKNAPKVLNTFVKAAKDVDWISEPLKAGEAQYKRERFKSRLKGISKPSGMEKGKDKGIEPEM
ncbi:MAG: hypothetical protein AAF587_34395 [Bacteroidota bacterium]